MAQQTDNWVTQKEMAKLLSTSIQRIHNWIKRGKIDAKYNEQYNVTLVDKTSVSIKTVK